MTFEFDLSPFRLMIFNMRYHNPKLYLNKAGGDVALAMKKLGSPNDFFNRSIKYSPFVLYED